MIPVGHYLGPVHGDAGRAVHLLRVGTDRVPLESAAEVAVWFTAHAEPIRERVLAAVPGAADAAYAALVEAELLVDPGGSFADRYRLLPATIGQGVTPEGGYAIGAGERTLIVDEPVFLVWECAAEHPTLRAACAAAGVRIADVVPALHGLLAAGAAYVDRAA